MEYTSAHFAGQAASDLKSAQALARESRSGYSLATAMYLAQQSMEKQLKATVLRLDEVLKVGLEEGFYSKILGHTFYSRPHKLYLRCVRGAGFPRGLDDKDALESAYAGFYRHARDGVDHLKKFGEAFGPKFFDVYTQGLLLQHCLRVHLHNSELRELDSYAHGIFRKMHGGSPIAETPSRFVNRKPKDGMMRVLSDKAFLARLRRAYYQDYSRVVDLSDAENLFMSYAQKTQNIQDGHEEGKITPETAKKLVRVAIAQYVLISLAWFGGSYMRMIPHATLGRYPRTLHNGRNTTDIYASQANNVLHELFVVADYNHMRISWIGKHIDNLDLLHRHMW